MKLKQNNKEKEKEKLVFPYMKEKNRMQKVKRTNIHTWSKFLKEIPIKSSP